jgi:GntR family transcriptional regulator, transcriptional repressor for pyruvate dehydrogenase complex
MPIQTIENPRLYRQIAAQLSNLIAAGEFPEGSRLPSERDLAEQLGVSRPSVREALIALEVQGKVVVRVGAGVFVAPGRPVAVPDPLAEGQGPFELLRARWLIEGECAAEAARNASAEDLEIIRAAVRDMGLRQKRNREADAADRAFHIGIANAAHNSPLVSVVTDLWDQGRGQIWKRMEDHFQTQALRTAVLRDHQTVLTALESKDSRAARKAMRAHLENVEREFNRGWDLLKDQEPRSTPVEKTASRAGGRGARAR